METVTDLRGQVYTVQGKALLSWCCGSRRLKLYSPCDCTFEFKARPHTSHFAAYYCRHCRHSTFAAYGMD